VIVIRNGTLIDGSGGPPKPNDAIVIDGELIRSVGKLSPGNEARVIDAAGKFILPGLIDGHCHLSLHQGAVAGMRFPSSAEYCTLWAARCASRTLRAGVTSISVPGGKWFVDVNVRDAVKAGRLEGPRIFCAGQALTSWGGIFDGAPAWTEPPKDVAAVVCNSVDEFTREVRRQCKHGVDLIKLADSVRGEVQALSEHEMRAVVDEAHRRGVRVCIHARGAREIGAAARAGVDWIFHGDCASDEELDVIARAGIPIMPCFTSVFVEAEHGPKLGYGKETHDLVKRQLEQSLRTMEKARRRGIAILSGSDTGNAIVFEHGLHHGREAQIFVEHLGFTPMEAIVANTSANAKAVGLEGQVGVIAPGKLADIIILDRDPLQDIAVLGKPERLAAVIKGGKPIDLEREAMGELPYQPRRVGTTSYWL
jgi:imidazolonepropionase-like amidohydrolase